MANKLQVKLFKCSFREQRVLDDLAVEINAHLDNYQEHNVHDIKLAAGRFANRGYPACVVAVITKEIMS